MRRTVSAATVAALLLTGACTSNRISGRPATKAGASADSAAPTGWTGAQARYGGDISRVAGVTYQPDVVVLPHGSTAVRSVSADGLVWTMDPAAPGVRDLRVGRIMLATALAAGRVLALSPGAAGTQVVLGPVALTDVIRDADLHSTRPVPLTGGLYYTTRSPSTRRSGAGMGTGTSGVHRFADAGGPSPAGGSLPAPSSTPPEVRTDEFTSQPICCSGGLGLYLRYGNAAGRLSAAVQLEVGTPSVSFHLRIGGGRLLDAGVALHGAVGLHYHLFGVATNARGNVNSGPIPVPASLTIPIGGPFTVTIGQNFEVAMAIGGYGQISADGEYAVSGDLGFGSSGGGAQADHVAVTTAKSVARNTSGSAAGETAFKLNWDLRVTVGVGISVLNAGVWYELIPGLAIAQDNSPLSLGNGCTVVGASLADRFGVGYRIPEFVATAVNAVLGLFRVPPLKPVGGPSWGPYSVWQAPSERYCRGH